MAPLSLSPIPSPSVVHNPGRLFKEFSTRVLVIYLDSAHPARPAGDRPPPHHLALSATSLGPFFHLQHSRPGPAPECSRWLCWTSKAFRGPRNLTSVGPANPLIFCGPSSSILLGPSFSTGEVTGDF